MPRVSNVRPATRRGVRPVAVLFLLVLAAPVHAELPESLKTLESRPGVSQPFLLVEPAGAPALSLPGR